MFILTVLVEVISFDDLCQPFTGLGETSNGNVKHHKGGPYKMLRRRKGRERKERNTGKKLEEENWDHSYFLFK